jgi:RNA chaperone Hfq
MNIINTCQDAENNQNFEILIKTGFVGKKASIYLVNGIKMSGIINDFQLHRYILLQNNNLEKEANQMIFWSAVATITHNGEVIEEQICSNKDRCKNKSSFLDELINKNMKVFLCNGIKLQGFLKEYIFQEYMIIERDKNQQLIFWNAIATISPVEDNNIILNLINEEKEEANFKMKNDLLNSLLNTDIVTFLKNGIKLKGTLTSCFHGKDDFLTHIVIDKNQVILIQHVSTITQG